MFYIYTFSGAHTSKELGEGPWSTKRAALDFGEAEVGVPWVVVKAPTRASRKRNRRRPGVLAQVRSRRR